MNEPLADVLKKEPVFAVTADMDWASEDCITLMLEAIAEYGLTPTLFMTHDSKIAAEAARQGRAALGIHPNFLPGSSHGQDPVAVVAHVKLLVPDARASRAHAYASSSHIIRALTDAGIAYDSGPLLLMQQGLFPLRHGSGLVHLPVFWEDDAHWDVEPDWDFTRMKERFLQPGLKIIDIHPFFFALNVPSMAFYQKHKSLIPTLTRTQAAAWRHKGDGCATFTHQLFKLLAEQKDCVYTLDKIFDWYCQKN